MARSLEDLPITTSPGGFEGRCLVDRFTATPEHFMEEEEKVEVMDEMVPSLHWLMKQFWTRVTVLTFD